MSRQESLLKELEVGRKEIKTDSYSMSIGEIINLYRDGELELAPAYQRLFRWEDEQKSRFIESILLGIPLPPIFVAQKEGGKWSIVDGLQRVSTILQLTGDLKQADESGKLIQRDPLVLTSTKKLPSLENLTWETLHEDVKRLIKRAKFGISIILTENSIQAQYELFQRLNTGGLFLEPQEIRNCLIIMLDESFYDSINKLKEYSSFKKTLRLQDSKISIEFPMELILRYFISRRHNIDFTKYKLSSTLLSEFIDDQTIEIIQDPSFILENEIKIFKKTFDYLFKTVGDNIFRKYNLNKKQFEGAFSLSAFEAIVPGVGKYIEVYEKVEPADFKKIIIKMYSQPEFVDNAKRGNKALSRIKGMIDFSINYFKNEVRAV
ncbi:DUF262 domain-containing protein [Dyadobacter sp. Leaf189]|uniref:DUF262 domain-containing protein n=1 Tax=Dyadobacter sp. Leaf189 TaxID=1736295 RepID=UPI0006F879DB|nr:DUF262 domain-containing protein [Dyadobacter sp. Leaf189]KQS27983.1 hypothetical protein ASG33_16435 [Dyadobacter sp. Leaf189]